MKKLIRLLAFAFVPVGANAADVPVTENISADTTWTADNDYILRKPIFVTDGAVLTIEPGTYVYATEDIAEGTFGSLVITRGCKIMAQGTPSAPIHFTALEERDGVPIAGGGTREITLEDSGYWGGLIILGNAILNTPDNPAIGGSTVGTFEVEGFPAGGDNANIQYGGNNDEDDSGVLTFVSIRYGGFEFAQDEEINGLTLGAVGSGTTIKFVEVFNNQDDGVEMFGGTVDMKYMVMAFNEDESFDWDQGYRGRGQFWFALQKDVGAGSNYGAEMDGGDGDDKTLEPYAIPVILNATYIGSGANGNNPQSNAAWRMKDNTGGKYYNSVFDDFKEYVIRIDDDATLAQYDAGNLASGGNVFGLFGDYLEPKTVASLARNGSTQELGMLNGENNSNTIIGDALVVDAVDRDQGALVQVDPRVTDVMSPVWDTTTMIDIPEGHEDFFTEVDWKGAFGTFNWAKGWTYLDRQGYMATAQEDNKLDAEFINVSTRGLVGTGAGEEMNVGFILRGNEPQTVLFIGKGPSLGAHGIANPLADPRIEIRDQATSALLAENHNWQDSPNAGLIELSTIPPSDEYEAAEVLTLSPGKYTMLLFGQGVGQGEIFIYR